jgi:hypothetical protein
LIRDRFALALVSLTVGGLLALGAYVDTTSSQPFDVVVLWLASALQLGFVVTWVFIPRLPKWIIGGWGLILCAAGLGVTIAGPAVESGQTVTPWALIGLVTAGILTIVAGVIHGTGGPTNSAV